MTDAERFEKENEAIADIIRYGKFLNAEQGIQVGKWIAEGFAKGLTQSIELPTHLEGSD